ncbi:MAG: hypothetical protein GXO18_04150 [Aquificae bacterium]|nr:hypothetical protein [Aquificota bacterium]
MKRLPLFAFGFILTVLFIYGALQLYGEAKAKETLESVLDEMGIKHRTTFGDVEYNLIEDTTTIHDLVITLDNGLIKIERILVSEYTSEDLELLLENVRLYNKNATLEDNFNLFMSLSFNDKDKRFMVRELSINSPGSFKLSITLIATGITKDLLKNLAYLNTREERDIRLLAQTLADANLHSFSISFSDRGFLSQIIRHQAEIEGITEEEFKRKLLEEIEHLALKGSDFEKKLSQSLRKLITQGGTLRIYSSLSEPVKFEDVIVFSLIGLQTKSLEPISQLLNLQVEHKREITSQVPQS